MKRETGQFFFGSTDKREAEMTETKTNAYECMGMHRRRRREGRRDRAADDMRNGRIGKERQGSRSQREAATGIDFFFVFLSILHSFIYALTALIVFVRSILFYSFIATAERAYMAASREKEKRWSDREQRRR
mmetsp:Transcript_31655/g.62635  ORF Transcript_31655/g.62635 Transcript_31655/m.62635 type:complete len:132 (-) Transcript_31655:892-1287(-)